MTIVNKTENKVEFGKIDYGSVFRDAYSNYAMKVSSDIANVVYLSDGMLDYMDDSEKVIRVRCELVVEN